MTIRHLELLLTDSRLTPEQLGVRLGISGMTIRRWQENPNKDEELPLLYRRTIYETVYELMAEDVITIESEIAQFVIKEDKNNTVLAAIHGLGINIDKIQKQESTSEGGVVAGMSQIGASENIQASVNRSKKKIFSYKKLGSDWKFRVQTLFKAITSNKLTNVDKFAAYGAIFYLISPFDLIPDNIPVFGLIDDYVVMGFVVAYYLKRYPALFEQAQQ